MSSLLACFGGGQGAGGGESAETPNLDKLRTFFTQFQQDQNTEKSFIQRPSSTDLCEWTKKVCDYMPKAEDNPNDDMQPVKQHFATIKQFYDSVQRAGWTTIPTNVQTFFQSIQIYECISGLACVIFKEHPDILKVIENQLMEAREAIAEYGNMGAIALLCCGGGG